MTLTEQIITIGLCALATMTTRFLPFMVFNEKRKTPEFIEYIGKYLPLAVFSMLIIYCLKDVNLFAAGTHGIPEAIAIVLTILIHLWRKNMLISIAAGTVFYMILIRIIPVF